MDKYLIINADDFYGKESYEVLAKFLMEKENKTNEYCMVGYRVSNTLSESGSVSRGVCEVDAENNLTSVVERTSIERKDNKIQFTDENGQEVEISENTPVSMNMWGFTPDYFKYSEEFFKKFLQENGDNLKSEFYIPTLVNELVCNKIVSCKVLDTPAKWFGVTYAEDRPQFVEKINDLVEKGVYPKKLWK